MTCANHRTADAQCLWCEVHRLRHLLGESEAQALGYLAGAERAEAALAAAEASGWRQGMAQAHDSEMGAELERLRTALLKVYECEG